MEFNKDSHCSFCGAWFLDQSKYPRKCIVCQKETYSNPLPVSVTLLDVWDRPHHWSNYQAGILIQRRNIEPKKGEWALNGGYLNGYEPWKVGAARELQEELGLTVSPDDIKLFDVVDDHKNHVLIFNCLKRPVELDQIKFEPNEEVSEIKIIHQPIELAFSTHTEMLARYFAETFN